MQVPDALVRQFYVAGSLRATEDGWALEARNPFGDGTVTAVGPFALDGQPIPLEAIRATIGDGEPVAAATIDRFHPLRLPRGVELSLHVSGEPLGAGDHELDLRLIELNLGELKLRIRDTAAG